MPMPRNPISAAIALWLSISARRPGRHCVDAFCWTLGVLAAGLTFAVAGALDGLNSAAGLTDTAIITRAGSVSEQTSSLSAEIVARVTAIATAADAGRRVSAEALVTAEATDGNGTPRQVSVRGMNPDAWGRRALYLPVEGRLPVPGRRELLAGGDLLRQFPSLGLGSELRLRDSQWRIVGTYAAPGDIKGSELWAGMDDLAQALGGPAVNAIYVAPLPGDGLAAFCDAVAKGVSSDLQCERESEVIARRRAGLANFVLLAGVGGAVGLLLCAVGAATTTALSAMRARASEYEMMRAIGLSDRLLMLELIMGHLVAVAGALLLGLGFAAWIGSRVTLSLPLGFEQVVIAPVMTAYSVGATLLFVLCASLVSLLVPLSRLRRGMV